MTIVMYEEVFEIKYIYINTLKFTKKYKAESLHFDDFYELIRHDELSCVYIILKYK